MKNENQNPPKNPYIPLDGKTYLSEEADGRFYLWDQSDFPHARILSHIPRYLAEILIRDRHFAQDFLNKIFSELSLELKRQAKQGLECLVQGSLGAQPNQRFAKGE